MCIMRRTSVTLAVALLAALAWSGNSFGRDQDDSQATGNSGSNSSASNDNSQTSTQNDSRNQDRDNRENRNQDRDNRNSSDNRNNNQEDQHHASLGISMVEQDGHVRVTAVMPGSPAAKAGVQVNDEIRAVDEQRIRTAEGLSEEIGEKQAGATVELAVRRNGERRTLRARLASAQEFGSRRNRQWQQGQQYGQQDQYGRQNGQWAQNGQQGGNDENRGRLGNWNRNRASSYDPDSQSVNQQVQQLRQQVNQLQQEVDELRGQQGNNRVGYRTRLNNSSRDGNSQYNNGRNDDRYNRDNNDQD
jgi:HSP20 family molecular chaperone IbpA